MILFKNALLADGSYQDILVEEGKIKNLSKNLTIDNTEVIDCQGRLLLSGMIDPHVHFRDPGLTHKEDAESGSKAAIRGGVTSIIDMPNTIPLCTTVEELNKKREIYHHKSFCNYGFHFGADARDNIKDIINAKNFASLKIFLNESTGHMLIKDDTLLEKMFQSSRFIAVHAEGDAVDKAIYFANKYQNILYLCHISQQEELTYIKKAKENNKNIFAEVCPHHILFNKSNETSLLTMKPQLRTKKDQEALLEALDSGLIDTWGTDHAPHLEEEKKSGLVYGIEGIEFALEILLTLAKEMQWSHQKVQQLYSDNIKKIFNIRNKNLVIGDDADFVIIDLNHGYEIQHSDIISKCSWSPYIGYKTTSQIHSTYIGGEMVYAKKTQEFIRSKYTKELYYDR